MRRILIGVALAAASLTGACTGPSVPATGSVHSSKTTATVRAAAPARPPSGPSTTRLVTPTSTSRDTTSARPTRSTTAPGAASTLVQADGDLNAAGPDDGPKCPVATQYSDEPPTGLRPDVRAAWIAVKKLAAAEGLTLCLNDGKRSRAQQIALHNSYVHDYGKETANDLVLPWQRSAHVKGYAVDVQPAGADQWLQATKGKLGFCRIYENEIWHFEYSSYYETHGCPARLPKP